MISDSIEWLLNWKLVDEVCGTFYVFYWLGGDWGNFGWNLLWDLRFFVKFPQNRFKSDGMGQDDYKK